MQNTQIKKKKRAAKAVVALAALTGACVIALYSGLVVRKYTIVTPKVTAPIRFVLITDLHSHFYGENQADLLSRIRAQKPDAILLAGDIIDDVAQPEGAIAFLEGVAQICPVYYVTGNHEYGRGTFARNLEILSRFDIEVLMDAYQVVQIGGNRLTIAGVQDPARTTYVEATYSLSGAMQTVFADLPKEHYSLLLAHRPERIEEYLTYGFDLVVSGHAHGGQVRVPFLVNGLYAPNQGWFPDYAGGLYKHGDAGHVVSRGLAIHPTVPRVFNPPEISVIDIRPAV